MRYEATILKIMPNDYEGLLLISINELIMLVAYQASYEFIEKFQSFDKINVDLWLVYGKAKKIDNKQKIFPLEHDVAGGTIIGQIVAIHSSFEFRLDCGLLTIDIDNEEAELQNIYLGDYIETRGTYYVYFQDCEYSRENMTNGKSYN
jgi:hypothetical protein